MRTPISVQMLALDASDNPASGTVCIRATEADYSMIVFTYNPSCGQLDVYGRLASQNYSALQVNASDDEGYDTTYTFTLAIDGQDIAEFNAKVPGDSTATEQAAQTTEGSAVITLTSLIAANAMLGQTIVGDNWPDDTTVQGISIVNNTLTLSNPATVTGVCTAVVGGAIMMETLQENQL
jgi:hypothetical protein